MSRGVTLPELADDFGFRTWAARQVEGEHLDQVAGGEQGQLGAEQHALLQEEELGEADQRLVVMPADPAAHLVLRHAEFAFGVLEAAFDPERCACM